MKRAYDVFLNDILVGYLSEANDERISFRFAPEYIQMSSRPVLSQWFEDDLRKIYKGKRTGDLPAFFANLIPEEGELRDLIENGLGRKDDLSVLEAVGLDLPGAVIIKRSVRLSEEHDPSFSEGIDYFNGEADLPESELTLRFSLAGIQLKFSVSREQERLTLPAQGRGGEWIVKLDSRRFPNLVENEFVMMQWAREAGFDVPECHIEHVSALSPEIRKFAPHDSRVFVIRRYDRERELRIHQEDFAQVVNLVPKRKYDHITYEKLAKLVQNISGNDSYYEYIRRLTFMIASGNLDAHLKNWSLIYPDTINARLAPLYDQVFVLAWFEGESPMLALKFASLNYIHQIDCAAFERLALRAGMDASKTIAVVSECLEKICTAWERLESKHYLPPAHLQSLTSHWAKTPILKSFVHIFALD